MKNKILKKGMILTLSATMAFSTMAPVSVFAAWRSNNVGWWWVEDDGSYPVSTWKTINGKRYNFDERGYMRYGWYWDGQNWYWLGAANDGAMKTGWQKVNGRWYYMNADGKMAVGWKNVKNKMYYLDPSGAMHSGWLKLGTDWYLLGGPEDGSMKTGWQKVNGRWYYMNTDGKMAVGWKNVKNKMYYLDPSGAMHSGWLKLGSDWYLLGGPEDGSMKTGWQKVNSKWYYMYEDGRMAADTWIGEYYVNASGEWVPGAVKPADPKPSEPEKPSEPDQPSEPDKPSEPEKDNTELINSLLTAGKAAQKAKDKADSEVSEAQKAVDAAQKKVDEADAIWADGMYGFFEWIGSTEITDYDEYSYKVKSSGLDALINPYDSCCNENHNKVGRGQTYDATNFDNVQKSLDYIDECNELRKGEGVGELVVDLTALGVAETNANSLPYHFEHCGAGIDNIAQNNNYSPFKQWYYAEKENLANGSGETGHYKIIIDPEFTSTGFGMNTKDGRCSYSQVFAYDTEGYTTDELRTLIQEYKEEVYGDSKTALENAKQVLAEKKAVQKEADELLTKIKSELKDLGGDTSSIQSGTVDNSKSATDLLAEAKKLYQEADSLR
ncbi:MAG: CAP domain-containing protein [Eubacterium sp.]|nr:CAP domain-containing protein [Eubacterium sp.]